MTVVIGITFIAWLGILLVVLSLCASAKRGDRIARPRRTPHAARRFSRDPEIRVRPRRGVHD